MRSAHSLTFLLGLIGCFGLLTGLQDPLNSRQAFAAQLVSEEKLQAIEAVHKRNIGQLHGLHHGMKASLKQLTKGRNDHDAVQQLAAQLGAVRQALDTVAATEKDHPQWIGSWSQRHARLMVLTQEMEALVPGVSGLDGKRPLDQLGKKLQEMKAILDVW